jgi:hypothetical protein
MGMKNSIQLYDYNGDLAVKIPDHRPGCGLDSMFRVGLITTNALLYDPFRTGAWPIGYCSKSLRPVSYRDLPLYMDKKYKSRIFLELVSGKRRAF